MFWDRPVYSSYKEMRTLIRSAKFFKELFHGLSLTLSYVRPPDQQASKTERQPPSPQSSFYVCLCIVGPRIQNGNET